MPVSATERHGLLAWCRAGFEGELAAELSERAAAAGYPGYVRSDRLSGHVLLLGPAHPALSKLIPPAPIFARSCPRLIAELRGLPPADRIGPLIEALDQLAPGRRFGDLLVEHADADQARPLAGLARAFGNALRAALRKAGRLTAAADRTLPRLHVGLLAGDHLLLAQTSGDQPDWPGGIPRLRMLKDAPSRSALKLEEALLVLLDADERQRWLQPGMTAADLGAAPGGWSWVLARHRLRVEAIDNGPLAETALATDLIQHHRADGFRWQPTRPLDWMVCDMVEQPRRVASRMATWLREGWCRRALFNLKLPMKKRWEETQLCLDRLQQETGRALDLRARQLYHDREEITVFAQTAGSTAGVTQASLP